MKRLLLAAGALMMLATTASADQSVRGYTRRDGTYVQPHMRTTPNATPFDNYSTRGNVNPYTGQPGTKDPYRNFAPPPLPRAYGTPSQPPCYGIGCR